MDFKELRIRGISHSEARAGAYALILEETESKIKLPIVIGIYEAQTISIGLKKDISTSRPLTHEVFSKFVVEAGYDVVSIVIHSIIDGVFYSNINFFNKISGHTLVLDARTSDAVAMAIRLNAPIYTTSDILREAGIILEIEENIPDDEDENDDEDRWENLSSEMLKIKLEEAVSIEDFGTAAEIQAILNNRNKPID